jgi:peptide/nickel transport system permease protein
VTDARPEDASPGYTGPDEADAPRETDAEALAGPQGRLARAWDSDLAYSFRHSPVAMLSAFVTVVLVLAAILAPLIAPYDPFDPGTLNLMDGFTLPMEPNAFTGNVFWLGTDDQGRDVFSTILFGLRISLFVGAAAVCLAMLIGITAGLVAGYVGGLTDAAIMRVADVQLTFPAILVAMLIFGIAKGITPVEYRDQMAIWVLILAIGLSDWVQFARVVRSATLVERGKEYVQAAQLIGRSGGAIMLRHILPNVLSPVLVIATISLALAIIAEATLSFLGVGAPPTQPSLGTLIRIGQGFLFSGEWWILFFPSVTLLALALSVNLLGDWLRDALNPRLK